MAAEARCWKCGAPVSDEVAGGFCTACLLEEGLSETEFKDAPVTLKYFGDYELIEEIARGGMGVVFKARQRSLNRIVAVKMILSGHLASEVEAQRFRAEARAAAALQHPGIVAIHEVGEHEGFLFFSMDYVEGQNLAQLVREGPLSAQRAAQCVREIANAIHYAHERGVLHRDLKPSNVLIDSSGKPHVTDFGLAKQLGSDSQLTAHDPHLTLSGQVLGSPNFMPPEQAAGKHRELTPASDVYSLGALLYHLLTGRPPFLADNIPATLRLVAETEPLSPRLLVPGVPRDLETICLKCLEKDPQRRYATAKELAEELERFLHDEPIRARPSGTTGKVWRWARRKPGLARTATAAVILFLAVTIGGPIAVLQINQARQHAEARQKEATLQAVKSEQVAQFLKDLLNTVGPSVALGRNTDLMREILDKTAQRLGRDLESQPAVAAEMRAALGHVYRDLGEYTNAAAMHRMELEILRQLPGNTQREIASALFDLGEALRLQGRQSDAEPIARQALELRRAIFHSENIELARSLESIALSIYVSKKKTIEGESLLRDSLRMKTRLLGPENLEVAASWHNLGVVLNQAGKFADAEAAHRRALDLRRKLIRGDHPDIAATIQGIGWSLFLQGKLAEADTVFRDALAMRRKLLSADHPELAKTLLNLGTNLRFQKRYSEAEAMYREALAISEKRWGTNHGATISPAGSLADVLRLEGKLSDAEQMYRRALAISDGSYGNWQRSKSSLVNALAQVLRSQGKEAEADDMLKARPEERWRFDGRAGRWKEAGESLLLTIQSAPDAAEPYLRLAAVFLILNEEKRYRDLCQQMLLRFSAPDSMPTADAVAKACSLHPAAGVDLNAVARAADTALALGRETEYQPWFQLAKALAEYRLGHFAAALDFARQVRRKPLPERDAAAYLVAAMAQAQLKQTASAREAFEKGRRLVESRLPKLDSDDLGVQWVDVLIANILFREARPLLQPDRAKEDREIEALREQLTKAREMKTNELAVAEILDTLADRYARQLNWSESEACAEQAWEIRQRLQSNNLPVLVQSLGRLCGTLDEAHKYSKAQPLLQQMLALQRKIYGTNELKLVSALGWIGWVFQKDKKHAEAQPFFEERLTIQRKSFGPQSTNLSESLEWLIHNLDQQKKTNEAAVLKAHLAAIRGNPATNAAAK